MCNIEEWLDTHQSTIPVNLPQNQPTGAIVAVNAQTEAANAEDVVTQNHQNIVEISTPKHDEYYQCLTKRTYYSLQLAYRSLKNRKSGLEIYRCPHCLLWHMGTPRYNEAMRIRRRRAAMSGVAAR